MGAPPKPELAGQANAFQAVGGWGRRALAGAYATMGLFERHVYTVAGLRKSLDIVVAKQRLHDALVDMLVREQLLVREGDLLRVRGATPAQDLTEERQRLAQAAPELAPFLVLLARGIECLPQVLTGRVTATEALFPDGRMDLVEPIYQGSRLAEHFNGLLAEAVATLATGIGRPVRILEIGAGTGHGGHPDALVRHHCRRRLRLQRHLERLRPARLAALRRAHFMKRRARRRTRSGGAGSIARSTSSSPNVLHGTTSAGPVTCPGGPGGSAAERSHGLQDYATPTFGLTDGWWAFEDAGRRIATAALTSPAGAAC